MTISARALIEPSPTNSDLSEERLIRVLHVDDETGLLKAAKQILEAMGPFQIESVSSVEKAKEKLKKKTYDVIISDYQMPQEDGLQFLKELRDSGNDVPFIIFTGKGREEVAIKALNFGADQYLNKLGDPETVYGELSHSIQRIMRAKHAEEELRRSEEKYRSIVELAPDSIMTFNLRGVITSCNSASTKVSGYLKKELVGKHFSKISAIRARDIPKFLKMLPFTIRGKIPEPFEIVFQTKNGTTRQGEVHMSLMKVQGKTMGIQAIMRDITERKNAEVRVKKSEEKYRNLFETTGVGIISIDTEGRFTSVNNAICKITGYSKKELVGKPFIGLIHPDDRKRILETFQEFMKAPDTRPQFEFRVVHKKGHIVYLHSAPAILRCKNMVIGSQAVITDITERMEIEKALQLSEKQFRDIFNLAPDGIATLNMKGTVVSCNIALGKMMGYLKAEIEGKHFSKLGFIRKRDVPWYMALLKRILQGKIPDYFKTTLIHKNGASVYVDVRVGVLSSNGKMTGFQVVIRDITENRMIVEQLNKSEERFRSLIESAAAGVCTLDLKGRFTYVNDALANMVDYPVSQIIGHRFIDFLPYEGKVIATNQFSKKSLEKEVKAFDFQIKRKNGEVIHLALKPTRLVVNGKLIGFQAIIIDITGQKRAEKAAKETMIKLALINEKLRVVGRLTRHDVENKLVTATTNVYLAKQVTNNQSVLNHLSEIKRTIKQTERILDFARTYERLGMEELTFVDVGESFAEAARQFPDLLSIDIANGCKGLMVLADSLLIKLFYNLIDNSFRHGKRVSQIKTYFKARARERKDLLEIFYEDDGVGVQISDKKKIFMEGYGEGTGYGLYLIRKMCDVYGWTINETGEPGKGVQFSITIPRMNENRDELYRTD